MIVGWGVNMCKMMFEMFVFVVEFEEIVEVVNCWFYDMFLG